MTSSLSLFLARATVARALRLVAVIALAFTVSCSVERRSEQFRCGPDEPCAPGRRCVDSWCVVDGDGSTADAGVFDGSTADAFVCPAGCTRCDGAVCVIECIDPNSCAGQIVCPAGGACRVRCTGAASCSGGVDCGAADSCQIQCTSEGTCRGALLCGDGPCDISCSGGGSCIAGINCESSCACDVTCQGSNSCSPAAACPAIPCRSGAGCSATASPACDTCP